MKAYLILILIVGLSFTISCTHTSKKNDQAQQNMSLTQAKRVIAQNKESNPSINHSNYTANRLFRLELTISEIYLQKINREEGLRFIEIVNQRSRNDSKRSTEELDKYVKGAGKSKLSRKDLQKLIEETYTFMIEDEQNMSYYQLRYEAALEAINLFKVKGQKDLIINYVNKYLKVN